WERGDALEEGPCASLPQPPGNHEALDRAAPRIHTQGTSLRGAVRAPGTCIAIPYHSIRPCPAGAEAITMPKRTDLKKILLIGSGPIVIGQACEFDYSGSQACKALREEGYEVVLVNSNPATIMTDPEMAHRTYVEPITWEVVARIIEKERPDALLPTVGGQTG